MTSRSKFWPSNQLLLINVVSMALFWLPPNLFDEISMKIIDTSLSLFLLYNVTIFWVRYNVSVLSTHHQLFWFFPCGRIMTTSLKCLLYGNSLEYSLANITKTMTNFHKKCLGPWIMDISTFDWERAFCHHLTVTWTFWGKR